jgi:2'-5' RNA ligase
MTRFRGFIAIDIEASPTLRGFMEEIEITGVRLKLVKPENIHITLKFLGETEETQITKIETIMKEAVEGIAPFPIILKGSGVFPNQNYIRVIWIGLENGENIETISRKIEQGTTMIGFKKEKRAFTPHLTIGRVKSAKNKEKLLQVIEKYKTVEFEKINVDAIQLKKSELTPQGPIYTTLKDIKL